MKTVALWDAAKTVQLRDLPRLEVLDVNYYHGRGRPGDHVHPETWPALDLSGTRGLRFPFVKTDTWGFSFENTELRALTGLVYQTEASRTLPEAIQPWKLPRLQALVLANVGGGVEGHPAGASPLETLNLTHCPDLVHVHLIGCRFAKVKFGRHPKLGRVIISGSGRVRIIESGQIPLRLPREHVAGTTIDVRR